MHEIIKNTELNDIKFFRKIILNKYAKIPENINKNILNFLVYETFYYSPFFSFRSSKKVSVAVEIVGNEFVEIGKMGKLNFFH